MVIAFKTGLAEERHQGLNEYPQNRITRIYGYSVKMTKPPPESSEHRRRGRPATGRKRPCQMLVHLTLEERAEINAAAQQAGLPPTVWALHAMLAAARKSPGKK